MSNYLPSSDGLMRSTLRETIKRIRRIRARAGREDEQEEESTGDPFRDLSLAFIRCVLRTKEAIKERNEGTRKYGQDRMAIGQSNEIRKDIRNMETLIDEMKKYVDASESGLAAENKKKKPNQKKIGLLEKQRVERTTQWKECITTLELVREQDQERVLLGKKDVDIAKELQVGRRAQLREQLLDMHRPRRDGNGYADPNEGIELHNNPEGNTRLKDHEATKESMQTIEMQDAKIDAGLNRLKVGVGRLRNLAFEIGAQIDMQNQMLEKTELTMDKQMDQIRHINRRLIKFMKETKPMNTFLNVCCVVLIVAIVGFFLVQFKVI